MDTKKAVKDTGEETPVSTPPVEEQKTTPEVPMEVPDTAEKPEQTPETPEEPTDVTEKLPTEGSEQARAFAEMRRKIKDLETQVKERETRQVSFDNLRQITPPPQVMQVDPSQFVDPSTGTFNKPAFDYAQNQANIHNQQVSRQIASEQVEYKLDEYRARERHPSLNTNRKFERAVASEYQARLLETIGNPTAPTPSIERIADEYAPYFGTDAKTAIKKATEAVKEQMTAKEQASLTASGRSQPAPPSDEEYENLRTRSRKGDSWAVAERMKRIR